MKRALAIALTTLSLAAPATALAQECPKATLGDVEDEVMCPRCGRPLNTVDREPQAQRQRALIQDLIEQCRSKDEIKAALVDEFGTDVLALPEDDGFNATAYIVPVAAPLAALGLALLAATRWRRRRPAAAAAPTRHDDATEPVPRALDADDAARLDEDLERYRL